MTPLQHALDRVPGWVWDWRRAGKLVLLLDFDGTLSPIVPRAEDARLLPGADATLRRLGRRRDVDIAVISGRALSDVSDRVGIDGLLYAGNHGMEIAGPGMREIAPEAVELRPQLEAARTKIADELRGIGGVWIEDKGLTLTVHHREADAADEPRIRDVVAGTVEMEPRLHMTSGKKVLEVRPRIDYDKGTAVGFLLRHLETPAGAPILYLGDDRTDEDAFRAVRARAGGEGVIVAENPPADTAALSYLRDVEEVAGLLAALAVQE